MENAGGRNNNWTSSSSFLFGGGFTTPDQVNDLRANVSTTLLPEVDRLHQRSGWKFIESPMYKILANILTSANQPPFLVQKSYQNETLSISQNDTLFVDIANASNRSAGNNTARGETNDDELHTISYDLTRLLLIIIAGTLLSLMTAGGNLLVLLSFKIDKQLRTISNYFLFSLGVADLTVGLVSIPLMTLYTAENGWTLGYAACQVWLSIDYLMSNASVCNLLLISFDRFFSLIRPLTYRPRRTKKKAFIMIALTFIVSLVLWPPWIITWPYIEGEFALADDQCMVQFLKTNRWVTLGTAILAFYLPVIIMVVLYAGVFYVTQTRHKELAKLQAFQKSKSARSGASGGQRRSITENSQKFSEYSSLHQTDTYNEFSDTQPENNRVLGRTKSWGIQSLVDHFTNRRIRSSIFKRGSIISSGFEEESNVSNGSGEFPEEDTPLRHGCDDHVQLQQQGVGIENRGKNRSNRRLSSRKKSNVQRLSSSANPPIKQSAATTTATNIETPLTTGSTVHANNTYYPDSFRSDNLPSQTNDNDTDSTYTVLIHLTNNSAQSRGPSITLYDDNSSPDSRSSMTPPTKSLRSHPAVAAVAAAEILKRQSVMSDSLSETNSPTVRAMESNSLKSKDSLPTGLLSLLPGSRFAQGSTGSSTTAAKRKQRAEKKQESKAAKTLSAILLAFIVTWTPYNVIVCIEAFLPGTVPDTWFTFSYYLCYINSTVNPVLYALCNVNFRRCFYRILKCQWSKRHDRSKDNSSLGYLLKK